MADKHWLNEDGLLFFGTQFLNGIRALLPTKTSDLTNDSNFAVDSSYVHTDNNYTTTEKNKLSGIASGAQVNVIETVKVNNTALTPSSKAVNISVPTKTSDITNDSGFITSADVPEGASASTATPLMDGTAAVGTSTAFARGDHRHPSDSNKVDKVSGKGLSTNDYTTAEKNKLSGIESGADANLPISVDGTDNEVVSISVGEVTGVEGLLIGLSNSETPLFVPDGVGFNLVLADINADLGNKVDKENGKGLSTNDYTTTEKNKLAAFSAASNYALKSDITNAYIYKGSVATVSALPSSGQTTGDVYNVEATGMNYAWNGTAWDALGEIFTITALTNAEITSIVNQVFA